MTRKERLQLLVDEYHRGKSGDYEDSYASFANTYGLNEEEDTSSGDGWIDPQTGAWNEFGRPEGDRVPPQENPLPVPRYAITTHDETYSMVEVFDNIDDALSGLLGCVGQDTLNIPGFLIDLDTGDTYDYSMSIKLTGKSDVPHLRYLKEQA